MGVEMAAVGEAVDERAFVGELHLADGGDGARETIAKTPHINAQQAREDNADGGFVRDHEHVALRVTVVDFLDDLQRAAGDDDGGFAAGGAVPSGIGGPADVVVMIFLGDFGDGFAFPFAVADFHQVFAQFHFGADGVAERFGGGDGAAERAGVHGGPGCAFISLGETLGHGRAFVGQVGIEIGAAEGVVAAESGLTVAEEKQFEAHGFRGLALRTGRRVGGLDDKDLSSGDASRTS